MSHSRFLLGPVVLPLLAFVALTDTGCATTIAGEFPHLERRKICVHLPEDPEASEYLLTKDGTILSNFQRERVRLAAPSARTVLEFDPEADPSSVRHLPARYQDLECAPAFSMLPAIHKDTSSLPEAAIDVLVHEQRPDPVPKAIAEKLASCANQNQRELESDQYTMTFNVYLNDTGQATAALLVESTLGDRPVERCIVEVLRNAQWSAAAVSLASASEPPFRGAFAGLGPVSAPPGVKSFFGQSLPAPNQPPPPVVDRPSGVYKVPPSPTPAGGGARVPPRIFVVPLGSAAVMVLAFGVVYYLSSNDAPAWSLTMNPMTGKRYTSQQEYDEAQGLAAQKLQKRPPLQITAALPKPPPAPATTPAPTLTPTASPAAGTRRNPGQTCDDSVLDELEKQKRQICTSEEWSCSDDFEKIGKKKEKRLTCPELLPRLARGQACLNARLRVQAECYAGSPDSKHDDQIDGIRKAVKWCADKAAVRGPNGGPCQ